MENALNRARQKGELPDVHLPYPEVEPPANREHGDYAANAAMILASQMKQNPRKIAQTILENIVDDEQIIDKAQIAGPGFINFFLKENVWHRAMKVIEEQNDRYGRLDSGQGKKFRWNLSVPIPRDRCISGMLAARWSAMSSPVCYMQPVMAFPANITLTMPGIR